jgi:hypothetical protein
MKTAKQYILERYLHSTPEEERELFWKTDGIVHVRDVEDIVCGYAEMVLNEFIEGIEKADIDITESPLWENPRCVDMKDVKLFKEKYIQ